MESASSGWPNQARDISGDVSDLPFGIGKACKELGGVGVSGVGEQDFGRAGLHVLSCVHDPNPLADLARHTQIMGDEENRDLPSLDEALH